MELEPLICGVTGADRAVRGPCLQSLWSGYGEIRRYFLSGADADTVVVKHVRPPPGAHPRKLRSYAVEQAWYRDWSLRCGSHPRVPRYFGGEVQGNERAFVLEDLDEAGFPGRRGRLTRDEMNACLRWLAAFHARFLGEQPDGLWPVGTYWHLATRPDELRAMRNQALRRAAPGLDRRLNDARWQTLVHGDAKPANFCFSPDGAVAAVDFQYVGGGCGIRDVAYLLEGGRQRSGAFVAAALDGYFRALRDALPAGVPGAALEAEWRGLYTVANQDFLRFLDGWGR